MEYFTEFGYIGLFFASFLAATILPLSSEVIFSFLLLNNLNPTILVSVATFGNVLGSFMNYSIGVWGSIFFIRKVLKISEDEFVKAKQRFQKYGVFSLFYQISGEMIGSISKTQASGTWRIRHVEGSHSGKWTLEKVVE
jgi:membrane protein YqaA with SNARE-associated domain